MENVGSKNEKRNVARSEEQISSSYADWDLRECISITLNNYSSGGVNFFSDIPRVPGEKIFFQTNENINALTEKIENEVILPAQVVWCRENIQQRRPKYSVGVKFTPF